MKKGEKGKTVSVDAWFLWLLFIILFVLKLNPGGHLTSAVVDWSWWVVFMPIWIIPAIMLVVFVVWFISFLFLKITGGSDER